MVPAHREFRVYWRRQTNKEARIPSVMRPIMEACVGGMNRVQGTGHLKLPVSPSPLCIAFIWFFEIVSEVTVSGKRL